MKGAKDEENKNNRKSVTAPNIILIADQKDDTSYQSTPLKKHQIVYTNIIERKTYSCVSQKNKNDIIIPAKQINQNNLYIR